MFFQFVIQIGFIFTTSQNFILNALLIFNLNNIKTDFNLNNSLNSVNWRSKDFIIIQFAAMLSKIEFTVFIGWTCSASEDSFKSHFSFFLHFMLFARRYYQSLDTLFYGVFAVCKGVYRNVNICLGFCLLWPDGVDAPLCPYWQWKRDK